MLSMDINVLFPIGNVVSREDGQPSRRNARSLRASPPQGRRLSQRELGELAQVGTRFVSELERDKPTLRVSLVNQVLAVFGKTLGVVDAPHKDETQ